MIDQLSLGDISGPQYPTDRLLYGILPTPAVASGVTQLAQRLRSKHDLTGRPLAVERFHITLIHLGDYFGLPVALARTAIEAATTVRMPPFEVMFDYAGSFSGKSGSLPLVLRASNGTDRLMDFQRNLGTALRKAGLERHVHPQFTPHVTLLYDQKFIPAESVEPVSWTVNEFVLVHSLLGKTRHIQLGRWPLHS